MLWLTKLSLDIQNYITFTFGKLSVFSQTTLKSVNSVALNSKWTGSDIGKEKFPITKVHCVMGDYISLEQSIWPRLWEVTCHTKKSSVLYPILMTKYLRISKHSPIKKANMYTRDGIDIHFFSHGLSHGLSQIDCSGELYSSITRCTYVIGKISIFSWCV